MHGIMRSFGFQAGKAGKRGKGAVRQTLVPHRSGITRERGNPSLCFADKSVRYRRTLLLRVGADLSAIVTVRFAGANSFTKTVSGENREKSKGAERRKLPSHR